MFDLEREIKSFFEEQRLIKEVHGCKNYIAISIWTDYLSDLLIKTRDKEVRKKIIKYLKELKKI